MDEGRRDDHPAWPLRALLLAALGAVLGFLFDWLIEGPKDAMWTDSAFRVAAAAFLAVSGIVFAVSLERRRWPWSAAFAAVAGLVAGFVAGWNGSPNGWGAGEGWQFFSALLAVAIAVPLFQSFRDGGGRRPETAIVHAHVWTNLVLGAAACAFVGATILLTVLLAQLFHLIGLDFLRDLMSETAFMWSLAGSAFGGAVGLLRDRDQVLATLHSLGRTVLSVLAPVLALGLALFVLALPFTGLQPLWDQTEATTPLLLVCILGAVLLVNAAIGNSADEEARSPIVRYAALLLVPVTLPLAFVAGISTAKRIGQYGLTPDRLWACVFVLAAAAFALAYLYALVRGRAGWPEALRRANVRLAAALCLLALFLALPIVSFGAISARDQVARLESGRLSSDRFDWAAMRFDFGPSGRSALERLRASGRNAQVRELAARYLGAKTRHDDVLIEAELAAHRAPPPPLRLRGSTGPVPEALRRRLYETDLFDSGPCAGPGECLLFWKPGDRVAVALMDGCAASVVGRDRQARRDVDCKLELTAFEQGPQGWRPATYATVSRRPSGPEKPLGSPEDLAGLRAERDAIERGDVTVREVRYRQVFIGGKPAGGPFE
jgi:hypothetical protein